MILRVIQTMLAMVLSALASLAIAGQAVDEAQLEKFHKALDNPARGLTVESASTSEMPGMYEVQFANGPLVYTTAEGDFFIAGDLYSTGTDGLVNLTEQRRDVQRMAQLEAVKTDDMIVFSPEGETRAYISVFTDVTCFYCQKLHQEVPELNKRGVEVRYLAYPRGGVGSDGYNKLATAWCADDPQGTLTKLKAKQSVPEEICPSNPVNAQFQLGQQLGVRGTPAIVTQDGRLIPGYQSADDLMVTLGLN